jgi:hypothetical protein
MENSALIIIDFEKALQMGYAKLREEIVNSLEGEANEEVSDE